jgi:hypothetical protein
LVTHTQRKVPRCGGTFLLSLKPGSGLTAALALLAGVLALTVRILLSVWILLLLSGLLTAALLLSGFLTRVLDLPG